MKVLVTDALSPEGLDFLRAQPGIELAEKPGLSSAQLLEEIRDADALIVRSKTRANAEAIAAAQRLKVIGRAGAGVDNIDLEAATRKGIVVMNTPGGNSVSAAEHAFALLISLARMVPQADGSLRSGKWDKSRFVGVELLKKTLGVVGLGKIGATLVRRARGFDMRVIAYDPFVSEKYAADLGVELRTLDEVFSESDFISLHAPLNDQTRGMIRAETIARMKPTAAIINAARGGLVVEEDLARALESGRLSGAALDVFENEPRVHPRLLASDKVIVTPHIAGSTVEAQAKVGLDIAVQVCDYLLRDIIQNAVNFPSLTTEQLKRISPYLELGGKLGSFIAQISNMRVDEIGIRYYGDLAQLDYKPISNHILKSILKPALSETINEVNARACAKERGILVVESASSRPRSYSNLISVQLRSPEQTEWIEGAILHQGNFWLVSLDGIPVESPLGNTVLFIRNNDKPGVIGQVGTILGDNQINIASFVLGRDRESPHAVGVVNTDNPIPEQVLARIRSIPAVRSAQVVHL